MNKWMLIGSQLIVTQIISWMILLSPARYKIQSYLFPDKDELLSVIVGDVTGKGDYVKVLKFKTKNSIRVEFLEQNSRGAKKLITEKNIHHPYNGFFEYRGDSTQLAMGDVDGDGVMEVMAPSFDENLTAHLNVYYYDPDERLFYQRKDRFLHYQ